MYHQITKKRKRDIDFLKIEIKQKENFISGYRTQIDRLGLDLGLGLGLGILKLQKEIKDIQKDIEKIQNEINEIEEEENKKKEEEEENKKKEEEEKNKMEVDEDLIEDEKCVHCRNYAKILKTYIDLINRLS